MRGFIGVVADEVDVKLDRDGDGARVLVFRFTCHNGPSYSSTSVNAARLPQLPELMHKLEVIEAGS
ncbi:hypothetical protein [Nonomuraea lactucae]|uniref:hypothetical protein n=1 Tax=Nonomuraea lactucae TaxID=2249762 RepID=UPI000DE1BFC9|nr:hypothetical protein [Nonomuraea lactucae]